MLIDKVSLVEAMETSPMRTSSPVRIDTKASGDGPPTKSPKKQETGQSTGTPMKADVEDKANVEESADGKGLLGVSMESMDTEGIA